jgi:hypothetical protein
MRSRRYEADRAYVQAHKNDPDRRFLRCRDWRERDPENFQSLCKMHHGLKTRGITVIGIDPVSGWTIEAGEVPKILSERLATDGAARSP